MPAFLLFLLTLLGTSTMPGAALAINDDLDFRGLAIALDRSCRYYEEAAEQSFELCGHRLSSQELSHAYRQLIRQLEEGSPATIATFLTEHFTPCRPTSLLMTGYYSPVLAGSLSPSPTYRFPIYGLPPQTHLRQLSRADIASGSQLEGQEIAYLADPLDLFFLHVQGSGIIELPDGSRILVSYAGDNGRPYTSIGKVLIQQGKLSADEVSLATITAYLTAHPDQRQQVLNLNERYIFFKLGAPESRPLLVPNGSMGHPLTPGRSVAMDNSHYPPGILGILIGRQPLFADNDELSSWQPFSRLVVHQDSGAAIKGPHRLDLYMGSGQKAGHAAGIMKEKGSFAILIPNLSLRQVHSRIEAAKTLPETKGALTASGE